MNKYSLLHRLVVFTYFHTMPHFDAQKIHNVENIVRKGEITYLQAILHFSQCFVPCMALIFHFDSLPNNKILEWSKLKAIADDKKDE